MMKSFLSNYKDKQRRIADRFFFLIKMFIDRSFFKTIYFNLKYFPIKVALKLPVIVSPRVYLMQTTGSICIDSTIRRGMIKIGFGDVGIFDKKKSRTIWQVSGNVVFKGRADIGHGSKISVGGTLIIGENFKITAESAIVCHKFISIGNDVLIAWDNLIMDTDFHKIKSQSVVCNAPKPIIIGNNVWIGCRCTILKGTIIADNTVIAANSILLKEYQLGNCILGGNPARVLKENIEWE